jgi:hypothetical protein
VFTHTPPHSICPVGHAHVPPEHVVPPAHTVPHAPQFVALLERFVHTPLQRTCPPGQRHIPV